MPITITASRATIFQLRRKLRYSVETWEQRLVLSLDATAPVGKYGARGMKSDLPFVFDPWCVHYCAKYWYH